MKNNCLLLFKAQMINQFRLNDLRLEKDKKKLTTKYLMFFSFAILGLMLMSYCFSLAYGLGKMGISHIIPSYAITLCSLLTLFLTLLKANGVLFAFKDYDLLMSLPVKTSTIIASRFLTMYVFNLLGALIIMLPMGVAYCLFNKPSILFYIIWLIGTFLTPLIPTTLAAMIGALMIFIASRFKYTSAVSTILSFVLIIGIMIVPMFMGSSTTLDMSTATLTELSSFISTQLNTLYPIAYLFTQATVSYDFLACFLFIGISIGWYYAFIKLLALKYKTLNTSLMTHRTNAKFKAVALSKASPLKALYTKELKRYFTSSIYVLNTGIGLIMLLLFSILCAFMGPEQIGDMLGMPTLVPVFIKVVPFIISCMITMSCTSSVALSLEGKNLWIIQSAPILPKTLFDSKILVNLTLTIPASLLSSLLFTITFKPDFFTMVLFFVTPLVYCLFTAVWGMFINTKYPRFDWESDAHIVKQSLSAVVGMLGGTVFAIIPLVITLVLSGVSVSLLTLSFTLLIALITCILYLKLSRITRL